MMAITNKESLTVLQNSCLPKRMFPINMNIAHFLLTNTYLFWVKTGLFNNGLPVVFAQNPGRERLKVN